MKKLILLALAPLAMLGSHASAQTVQTRRTVLTQHGPVTQTVTRREGPARAAVIRTRVGPRMARTCRVTWRHGRRIRACNTRRVVGRHEMRTCRTHWRHGRRVRDCRVHWRR